VVGGGVNKSNEGKGVVGFGKGLSLRFNKG